MNRLEIHLSLQLAWAMANAEACHSGSHEILPVHFYLAILKIIDSGYRQSAEQMGFSKEVFDEIDKLANQGQDLMGMSCDSITKLRRKLRSSIRLSCAPFEQQMLHRSESSRSMFKESAKLAHHEGYESLTIVQILKCLLDSPPEEVSRVMAGQPNLLKTETDKPSVLKEMGRDLTEMARGGRLSPVVGRKVEMTTLVRYLQRTTKRNVIITGEAGVGKTAVVEGLAQRLISADAPDYLKKLRIVQISVSDLVAGTKYRGDMEQRLQLILAEATADPNLVLFIDEIHLAMKGGACGDGPMDIANILKPALARDDFRCIGATTTEEFERHVKNDAAFMRRFQVLRLEEPTEAEALQICNKWVDRIQNMQEVVFDSDAAQVAVTLTARFIKQRFLPDKAIDLLENAATLVKVTSLTFRNVAPSKTLPTVKAEHVKVAFEDQYGIKIDTLEIIDRNAVLQELRKQIVGQSAALQSLAESLGGITISENREKRPLGVFMFTGPSGVGKTYTAECLAKILFGNKAPSFVRFNMSEYKERHELSRLVGSPPGFIGHERAGALFKYAEANPQGLILLDEMEKAHPEIQDYFLQIFDKAEAMDSRGRIADFRRHLFVMTCNVCASDRKVILGFGVRDDCGGNESNHNINKQLEKYFRKEYLGRIDQIISFRSLDYDDYAELFNEKLYVLSGELQSKYGIHLNVSDDAKKLFCEECLKGTGGVRNFIRLYDSKFKVCVLEYVNEHGGLKNVSINSWANMPIINSVDI